MKKEQFTNQSFSHAICIDAPLEDVFYHVATADGLCRWFMGSATYRSADGSVVPEDAMIAAGDTYRWQWLEKELILEGSVLDCSKPGLISFSFTPSFRVEFQVSVADDGRTVLKLRQSYVESPPAEAEFAYINCCICWVFFLTNLKSVMEHDTDLRETAIDDEMLVNR